MPDLRVLGLRLEPQRIGAPQSRINGVRPGPETWRDRQRALMSKSTSYPISPKVEHEAYFQLSSDWRNERHAAQGYPAGPDPRTPDWQSDGDSFGRDIKHRT
jgi:hypothetical protein